MRELVGVLQEILGVLEEIASYLEPAESGEAKETKAEPAEEPVTKAKTRTKKEVS